MKLPMQPIYVDEHGTVRFRANPMVRHLLDNGGIDLNALSVWCGANGVTDEERAQFAQLIGYSLGGFADLSYVSDEASNEADEAGAALNDAVGSRDFTSNFTSNYKIVKGDDTFIKVINFPPAPGIDLDGESMWVLLSTGDENNGTGWLNNTPVVTDVAVLGSLVEFAGGTDTHKTMYVRTIEKYTGKFDGPASAEDVQAAPNALDA